MLRNQNQQIHFRFSHKGCLFMWGTYLCMGAYKTQCDYCNQNGCLYSLVAYILWVPIFFFILVYGMYCPPPPSLAPHTHTYTYTPCHVLLNHCHLNGYVTLLKGNKAEAQSPICHDCGLHLWTARPLQSQPTHCPTFWSSSTCPLVPFALIHLNLL